MLEYSTSPEVSAVTEYLRTIGQHELLTAEQEVELARRIETGKAAKTKLDQLNGNGSDEEKNQLISLVQDGAAAKEQFINSNLRLVVSIAKKYRQSEMELLDLIQEGNLGLIRAVEKFDYRKGFKFSTYATWWIRQSIGRGLSVKASTIRLPVHLRDSVLALHRTEGELKSLSGQRPSDEELAEATGFDLETISQIKRFGKEVISLHMAVAEDSDTPLEDLIADERVDVEEEVLESFMARDLAASLATLEELERAVIIRRFGLDGRKPASRQRICREFRLSTHRGQQIERSALAKLRERANEAERTLDQD